jgi:hypothetical protein
VRVDESADTGRLGEFEGSFLGVQGLDRDLNQ